MRALGLVLLAACGGDDALSLDEVAGAPPALRAFGGGDTPIAIGSDSAFGLAKLVRYDGATWQQATGAAPFGAQAYLFGDYAASDNQVFHLEDAATFAWSSQTLPQGVSVTLFGADGETLYGALPDEDGGAIVVLAPGQAIWREIARPIGAGARGFLLEAARVTWSDPARGVVRAEGGAETIVIDCTPEEAGACTVPLLPLYYDANGGLAAIACSPDAPPQLALRADAGGEVSAVKLPAGMNACTSVSASGRSALIGAGDLLHLSGTDKAWKRVGDAEPGLHYVEGWAYGDGIAARGVYRLR